MWFGMSGGIGGIDYSLLYNSGSSSSDVSSNILSILYSATPSSNGAASSTGNPLLDLKLAQQNQAKDVAQEAKDPTVVRDLALFIKGVANAKDVATALQNPNVLKVLLTANGLGDQAQYPALASKILLSNPADPNALVNQIADARWKTVVTNYGLATKGLAGLSDPAVQSQLASSYASVTWLTALNQTTPGLSSALTFQKQASSITKVDQILGDPVNRDVVLTALGIPQQIAYQSLTSQEAAVSSRIDIAKLQDPTFVTKLTNEYLLNKQQANQGTSYPSLDALAIQANGLIA
jgi:hypothetical protein